MVRRTTNKTARMPQRLRNISLPVEIIAQAPTAAWGCQPLVSAVIPGREANPEPRRRHCEEQRDEAIHFSVCGAMDCFALLAMTASVNRLASAFASLKNPLPPTVKQIPKGLKETSWNRSG